MKSDFRGELLTRGDQEYDSARRVFNATIDRWPGLIARYASSEDVARAVGFAREQGTLVSVRGADHNVAGFAVCDEGIVIDLSPMKKIVVDPTAPHGPRRGRDDLGRSQRRASAAWPRRDRRIRVGDRVFQA